MGKKYIAVGMAAVLSMALAVPVAYACGGHGRAAVSQPTVTTVAVTTCPVCTAEDCQIAGRHSHDGTLYCGYHHADGICDGTCRALCPVDDCDMTGYHTHNATAYCGSHHNAGFCDGSCQAPTPVNPVNTGKHHGHRGHH